MYFRSLSGYPNNSRACTAHPRFNMEAELTMYIISKDFVSNIIFRLFFVFRIAFHSIRFKCMRMIKQNNPVFSTRSPVKFRETFKNSQRFLLKSDPGFDVFIFHELNFHGCKCEIRPFPGRFSFSPPLEHCLPWIPDLPSAD